MPLAAAVLQQMNAGTRPAWGRRKCIMTSIGLGQTEWAGIWSELKYNAVKMGIVKFWERSHLAVKYQLAL